MRTSLSKGKFVCFSQRFRNALVGIISQILHRREYGDLNNPYSSDSFLGPTAQKNSTSVDFAIEELRVAKIRLKRVVDGRHVDLSDEMNNFCLYL